VHEWPNKLTDNKKIVVGKRIDYINAGTTCLPAKHHNNFLLVFNPVCKIWESEVNR